MADEAVSFIAYTKAFPMIVADGTGIEKGAVLRMTDPITAAAATAADQIVAGIAVSEKIASDGKVRLGVARDGQWKVKLSGSCTVGDPSATSETTNHFKKANMAAGMSGARLAGIFLETGTTGETVLMELRPSSSTNAA